MPPTGSISSSSLLPAVVRGVCNGPCLVRSDGHGKFNGVAVGLFILGRTRGKFPIHRTVEVFDHADFYGLLLVIANLDLERLVGRALVMVDGVVGAAPL